VPTFAAPDGTELAYDTIGSGAPVLCLPGGPMRDPLYLGDLGGLSSTRQLIVLDPRGTGRSAIPDDPSTYRCDRQVDDIEALRAHLGLDRIDLLAHSAGGDLGMLYAARYPKRLNHLALITPSVRAVGIAVTDDMLRTAMAQRKNESWYAKALATFDDGGWPIEFGYGRWDAAAKAHAAAEDDQRNPEAAAGYNAEGAYHPEETRAALTELTAPVLVLGGEVDWITTPQTATELAALFPNAQLAIQPGGAHYVWLDDPDWFTATVAAFLG
jgi:pimeloyl-ACP methyl ester carboxylesterase